MLSCCCVFSCCCGPNHIHCEGNPERNQREHRLGARRVQHACAAVAGRGQGQVPVDWWRFRYQRRVVCALRFPVWRRCEGVSVRVPASGLYTCVSRLCVCVCMPRGSPGPLHGLLLLLLLLPESCDVSLIVLPFESALSGQYCTPCRRAERVHVLVVSFSLSRYFKNFAQSQGATYKADGIHVCVLTVTGLVFGGDVIPGDVETPGQADFRKKIEASYVKAATDPVDAWVEEIVVSPDTA